MQAEYGTKDEAAAVRSRPQIVLLILGAVLIWVYAAWFVLQKKAGFLDDAYIYLHLANNWLETGTARYFPVADSWALLATSPLRLLILIPATFVARLLADPRGAEAARLTFLLTGPLTALVFLPFLRRDFWLWWLGVLASGILAVCTESALQMEGLLLFWIVLILARYPWSRWDEKPGRLGILLGMLLLTRPEYGLPVILFALAWAVSTREQRKITFLASALVQVALGWVLLALFLRVYPIPTTLISKVLTGQLGLFGSSFGAMFLDRTGDFFLGGGRWPAPLMWAVPVLTLAALATGAPRHRWLSLLLLLIGLTFLKAGGNYLWYSENLFISLVALISGWLLGTGKPPRWRSSRTLATVWLVLVLAMVIGSNWGRAERSSRWSLRGDKSLAFGYFNIGRAYAGEGVFAFPGTEPSYLVMREIGIVSYFGGADVWLFDAGGLAQPGTLEGITDHPLAVLYPKVLLISASAEMKALNFKFGREFSQPPIWQAYAYRDEEQGPEKCAIYLHDQAICLKKVTTR
jgi:hypothetical protein